MDIMAIEDGLLPLTYATQTHTHASNYLQQCKSSSSVKRRATQSHQVATAVTR